VALHSIRIANFKTGDTDTSQDPDKLYELYTVQVGAFAVKENAQRLADELKLKGYSCFIAKK
ncbi:MAG: SPOR domain-containing protein, partial [Oscillospiraceae bacterium]